jgi:zinc protease
VSILGGTHTSVLTQAIRVERGWSYDASATLTISRVREQLALWAAPAESDAPACLAEMLRILERFAHRGASDPQVAFARRHLRGAWAFEVDTADKRLFLGIDRALFHLPSDHHDAYRVRLDKLQTEAVNDALRARIAPDALWVAAVGDAETIAEPLRAAAGAADVVVVPYDA